MQYFLWPELDNEVLIDSVNFLIIGGVSLCLLPIAWLYSLHGARRVLLLTFLLCCVMLGVSGTWNSSNYTDLAGAHMGVAAAASLLSILLTGLATVLKGREPHPMCNFWSVGSAGFVFLLCGLCGFNDQPIPPHFRPLPPIAVLGVSILLMVTALYNAHLFWSSKPTLVSTGTAILRSIALVLSLMGIGSVGLGLVRYSYPPILDVAYINFDIERASRPATLCVAFGLTLGFFLLYVEALSKRYRSEKRRCE